MDTIPDGQPTYCSQSLSKDRLHLTLLPSSSAPMMLRFQTALGEVLREHHLQRGDFAYMSLCLLVTLHDAMVSRELGDQRQHRVRAVLGSMCRKGSMSGIYKTS